MNVQVAMARLRRAVEDRAPGAYVLTVTDDGRPHCVHADVRWDGETLGADVGEQTAGNASRRPQVSLLFPQRDADDYSLIVDGAAVIEETEGGRRVLVTPTRAVLHRNAPSPDPASSCSADCVPLLVSVTRLELPTRRA